MRLSRAALIFLATFALSIVLPSSAQQASDQEERRAKLKQCRLLLRESLDLIGSSEYDSALVRLRTVLEVDPKNADAFYHISRVLLWQGDTTEAVSVLARGIEKAPRSSRLKLLLARSKLIDGDLEGAADLLNGVLAIKPREGEALYLSGVVFLERGDTLQAIETWENALRSALESGP
jgi:cytochrome c-type biogenesis protein CcmH/NrfG